MPIELHHIAIVVADIETASMFYRKVFGLQECERPTGAVSLNKGAWFQMGPIGLHLQERRGESPKTDQHFAIITDKFEEIRTRVKESGGRLEEGRPMEGISKRCFLFDLDNNRIELLQRS